MTIYPPVYIAWDPMYAHPLPDGHRFPMVKYELIPQQLLYEGTIEPQHLFSPIPCPWEVVAQTHSIDYLHKLQHQTLSAREQRHIGFPQSPALTEREQIITQGTLDAARFALQHRSIGLNIAGGTHHAFYERGEGFCLLNDFAVAANQLLLEQMVNRILIVDLDVHQGNGTAKLFEDNAHVFTFSMHGQHNYPFHKEKSDLDIPLLDGTDDETYLRLLENHLPILIDQHQPEIVFYLSGVDILETDKFGKLKLSLAGSKQRDRFVLQTCKQAGIPVCVAMGGGYSPDVNTIVEAHCQTFRVAMELFS